MTGRLGITLLLAAVLVGTAAAAPGDPEKRAINAADQAWAQRINLTLRDLPGGFRQGPAQSSESGGFTCASFAPDLSSFTITGRASSHSFVRRDGTTLFSAAEIFRSRSDERGDWGRSARREALPCIAQMLEQLSSGGLQLKVTSSAMRAAPHVGERSISFRIAARVSAGGAAVKTWFDIIGVSRGRADATLAVISFRAPPSASLEQSLVAKLARRLAA